MIIDDEHININNTKPLLALKKIYDALIPASDDLCVLKDELIKIHNNNKTVSILFITNGRFSAYRRNDHLLIATFSAPSLLGIAESFHHRDEHYYRTETCCSGIIVDSNDANKIFSDNHLWKNISEYLVHIIRTLQTRDAHLTGNSTYSVIKNKLIELSCLTEEERSSYSVLTYIQTRSKISRSLIAKILADLRRGGYITMSKGKLILINYLPKDY